MSDPDLPSLADRLTRALLTGDFSLYRQTLVLPMTFTPRGEKPYVLQTEAALKQDFDIYVGVLRLHGVTDIYRKLLGSLVAGAVAEARWLTHILVRATLLVPPFQTRMRLIEGPDGWRISEIESAEGHIHWSMGRATLSDGSFKTTE